MGVDGTFFDVKMGEKRPDIPIPLMPYHDDKLSSKFQVHISNYDLDTFFDTLVREE